MPASCTNVLVGVSHATLGPGIPETVTPVLANCGSNALPSTTVSTTTTPPSGCGAAPAIPSFAAAVGAGASVSGPSTFMPNSCQGVYTVSSEATAGGSVVASATTTYTVGPVGTGVEYPTIDRPNAVVAGPDGTVWASEGSDTKVLQSYSPSGVIKTFHAPDGTINLLDLATGGDGNLYVIDFKFDASGTSRVLARVTPTGTFTLLPLPKNATAVTAVAAGPQGDIWVTVSTTSGSRIGRVTANGTITLLPPVGTPDRLTAGPDGAVWFTSGTSLGRITENGTSSTFALPSGITAGLITQGAGGNMWYLGGDSSGNNVVGSMSTQGVAGPVYPTPVSGGLYGFTIGADGNLWYNDAYGGHVDQVTPQGVFTQFSAPNPSGNAKSIAAGPDGNIWLGEYFGFNVAQVSTCASSACTPVSVTVNPFAAPGGSMETVTTTLTNCANVPRFFHVDTATTAPAGCTAPPKTAEHVALQPRVSTAETVNSATPACPGTYRVKSTLSIGGKVVAAASATYQVT